MFNLFLVSSELSVAGEAVEGEQLGVTGGGILLAV